MTREFVRIRGQGQRYELGLLIDHMHKVLEEKEAQFTELAKKSLYYYRPVLGDIERALDAIESPHINSAALKELVHMEYGGPVKDGGYRFFPDMEFLSEMWPQPENLLNLERFCAYARVGRASNVRKFTPPLAMEPNPKVVDAIHNQNAERARNRKDPPPPPDDSPQEPDSFWQ